MEGPDVKKTRKPRSKSLGPGGIEALNAQIRAADSSSSSKGKKRRESMAPTSQARAPSAPVKSILLPTVPVSPLRPKTVGKLTARRRTSLLNIPGLNMPPKPSNDSTDNDNITRSIPVRTEEEQAAAARARQRKEVLASRAERRKSLGNRRVSFATEATLHTFVVDDYPPTPSDAGATSRESTPGQQPNGRRRRSGPQTPTPKKFESDSDEDDENEVFSSSPIAPDGLGRLVGSAEVGDANDSDSLSSAGEGESDFEDTLGSKASAKKNMFPEIAPLELDEEEEMNLAKDKDEDITLSAKGMMKNFFKKPIRVIHGDMTQLGLPPKQTKPETKKQMEEDDGDMTMDMTKPVGGLLSNRHQSDSDGEGEADMDETRVVGGLLDKGPPVPARSDSGHMSNIGGLLSSVRNAAKQIQKHLKPTVLFGGSSGGDADEGGDMTMDMTRAVGGILNKAPPPPPEDGDDGEMDMDMTVAIGGVLAKEQIQQLEQDDQVQYPRLGSGNTFQADADGDATMDMDMTIAVGGLKKVVEYPPLPEVKSTDEDGDVPMDMTVPVGRILEQQKKQTRAQVKAQAVEFEEDDGQTMDLTVAIGGINKGDKPSEAWSTDEEVESLDGSETMDFTAVVGGGVMKNTEAAAREERGGKGRRGSLMGGVLLMSGKEWEKEQEAERQLQKEANQGAGVNKGKNKEEEKLDEDGDVDMDIDDDDDDMGFTAIIPNSIQQLQTEPVRELLIKTPTPTKKTPPKTRTPPKEPAKQTVQTKATPPNLFYGNGNKNKAIDPVLPSPGWIPPLKSSRFGKGGSASKDSTPTEAPAAPTTSSAKLAAFKASLESPIQPKKQDTEAPAAELTTSKKRATRSSLKGRASLPSQGEVESTSARGTRSSAKAGDASESASTPKQTTPKSVAFKEKVVETPPLVDGFAASARRRLNTASDPSTPNAKSPKRRLSGIGIDKPGLGSPSLVASLSRRRSIGENSPFRMGAMDPREALFESLRVAAEEKREEKRKANEAYVEDKKRMEMAKDESVDLKSRIEHMTPRKTAAEGLSKGKRKSDAFEDVGYEEGEGVKRDLFGEMTGGEKRGPKRRSLGLDKPLPVEPEQNKSGGRKTRSRASLETIEKATKGKKAVVISPQKPAAPPPQQAQSEEEADEEVPRITMQQFLDITGISFLDNITHTKRRQTLAGGIRKTLRSGPSALFKKKNKDGSAAPEPPALTFTDEDHDEEPSLGEWIIAGAATAAVYQLFWSSCTELKRYIAEGKVEMKRIEKGINAKNPKLFKEYMDAPVDLKLIMDSQFKSIKTHSRLLAKRDWYTWRTDQLLNLNSQLEENLRGLRKDEEVIRMQEQVVERALPEATKVRDELKRRLEKLVERRREVENCDRQELEEARRSLVQLREEVERKRIEREQKRKEAEELEKGVEERKGRMEWLRGEIEKAERVREMNRGFGEDEVWALRRKVRKMEEQFGWSIVSVERGSVLSMAYRGQLLLVFDAAKDAKPSQVPTVRYIEQKQEATSNTQYPPVKLETLVPDPVEQAYFLQILQGKIAAMTNATPRGLVKFVSSFWDAAGIIVKQISMVRLRWITTCEYQSTEDKENDPTIYPSTTSASFSSPLLKVSVKIVLPEHKAKVIVSFIVNGFILPEKITDRDQEDEHARFGDMVEVSARVVYCLGGKKVSDAALKGELKGSMLGVSVLGEAGGWGDAVEDVVGRCFVGEKGRRRKSQVNQQIKEAKDEMVGEVPDTRRVTRSTPKRAAKNVAPAGGMGKKIPVRRPGVVGEAGEEKEKVGGESKTIHVTRAAAKQSGIPLAAERKLGVAGGIGLGEGAKDKDKEKEKEKEKGVSAFEVVANPFGTGKRGIPVPTKMGGGES